jgi:hypothetical protein
MHRCQVLEASRSAHHTTTAVTMPNGNRGRLAPLAPHSAPNHATAAACTPSVLREALWAPHSAPDAVVPFPGGVLRRPPGLGRWYKCVREDQVLPLLAEFGVTADSHANLRFHQRGIHVPRMLHIAQFGEIKDNPGHETTKRVGRGPKCMKYVAFVETRADGKKFCVLSMRTLSVLTGARKSIES